MKRIFSLFLVIFLSAGILAGCQEPVSGNSKEIVSSTSIVEGGGQFPESLVGVWKSNNYGWAFKFEPDGIIKKLRHNLVREVNINKEKIIEMPGPEEGTYALFIMGLCETYYEPDTRNLEVTVFLDHYEIVLPNGVLEGRTEDYFTGQVSEDCKTWDVEWRPYGWLKGAAEPDPNLIEPYPEPLVFTKFDIVEKHNHSSDLPGNQ